MLKRDVGKMLWACLFSKQNFYFEITLVGKMWSSDSSFGPSSGGPLRWVPWVHEGPELPVSPERLTGAPACAGAA